MKMLTIWLSMRGCVVMLAWLAMGYRAGFFAVASEDAAVARQELASIARELRSENGYRGVYLASADRGGLHLMYLAADPAPGGRVPRDFFLECWSITAPLYVAVYNDRAGVYLWERHAAGAQTEGVLNDAHLVGTKGLAITVDYAGKGFTHAQLAEVMGKDEGEMTPAEARAVMEWTDAITIGLAQHGFAGAKRSDFIALLSAKTAWSLLDGKEAPMPRSAGPIVDEYIDAYTFERYGLEPRDN